VHVLLVPPGRRGRRGDQDSGGERGVVHVREVGFLTLPIYGFNEAYHSNLGYPKVGVVVLGKPEALLLQGHGIN
jgi:hypothetical protein